MVERLSAAGQHIALPDAIMITGTDDHDPPETMITINWIERSRWSGIGDHDRPECAARAGLWLRQSWPGRDAPNPLPERCDRRGRVPFDMHPAGEGVPDRGASLIHGLFTRRVNDDTLFLTFHPGRFGQARHHPTAEFRLTCWREV
jgi:hypothetical protein